MIGRLLGYVKAGATARYAHLGQDAEKAATARTERTASAPTSHRTGSGPRWGEGEAMAARHSGRSRLCHDSSQRAGPVGAGEVDAGVVRATLPERDPVGVVEKLAAHRLGHAMPALEHAPLGNDGERNTRIALDQRVAKRLRPVRLASVVLKGCAPRSRCRRMVADPLCGSPTPPSSGLWSGRQ